MRVSISGWRRNTDSLTRLVDRPIKSDHISGKAIRLLEEVQVRRYSLKSPDDVEVGSNDLHDQSGVRISTGVTIRTSGDFHLTIQFTTREIVLLAFEAMRTWAFDKFIRTFARFQGDASGSKSSGSPNG